MTTRVTIGLMYYTMTLPRRDDDNAERVEARVSVGGPSTSRGARHPGGYMCRVPSSTALVLQPRYPFKCPTARRRPSGIAGIIILSRRPAHESRPLYPFDRVSILFVPLNTFVSLPFRIYYIPIHN